ncbi:DUF3179 domain-containing (seleno)protein [uncultured Maribacter sp.]|uniref:DUF3179 domain-containing (seleno)protein n=1 Tax=uncultured Maribacter sp. TaxID=431308 RepID=UPI0030EE90A8|tara:strand:+ start:56 stop:868 length:813 start_codon:yes stop_codon:yes gene_type:complete
MKKIIILSLTILLIGCKEEKKKEDVKAKDNQEVVKKERPVAIENGKFFEVDGKRMLYGGENENQHFDITDYLLKDEQFHYGIGREKFPALLKPEFITVSEANKIWADSTRFLLAHSGNDIKAYSVKDLTRHEIVNDVLDGQPIMAVYCILADLGAIYDRNYGGKELTFALSGYTYYDKNVWNGLDGFVFWDRETESLWWPLIGKAVSGPLKNVKLIEMDNSKWKDTTWKDIKNNYPNAQVLKSEQDFERPTEWKKTENVTSIIENYTIEK